VVLRALRLVALLLGAQALLCLPANGEETFPYKAYVAVDDVYVRSGPGQNYYPTDKLKRGQEVEVYRHDPGGWCAVRPVEGSFAWVAGRYLKPSSAHLTTVTEDGVSARVGSRFSGIREVVQVRLQKGEVVEILEAPPRGSSDSGWFKIAPPSGEFRWISAKYLDRSDPREGVRKVPVGEKHGKGWDGETSLNRSPGPRSLSPAEFQAELDRIELDLSTMVIEEPAAWSFDSLRERTDQLLTAAQTAVERGRARALANRIARFDDIKQRQDALATTRRESSRIQSLADVPPPGADGRRSKLSADIDGRFDGVGELTQVVSAKVGAPRYALIDAAGDVRCYVTPAPGVNLQNYLGQEVGVTGTRGYMPEQRASHIMARHVTPLEGSVLR
jgi:SH3-like domain-containing protein